MKKMKRMAGFLLAVMMMVMMAAPAMAAGPTIETGTATITIKNPTLGETYTLYKVFDATVNTTDSSVAKGRNIAYSLNLTAEERDAFNNNEYFKIDDVGNITATNKAYAEDDDGNIIKDRLSAGAISWIKTNGTQVGNSIKPDSADDLSDGNLVFRNLSYGYYYVDSTLKREEQEAPAITVTSTNPDAVIIDKNQGPIWTPDPTPTPGPGPSPSPTPEPDPDNPNHNIGKMIVVTDNNSKEVLVKENSINYGDTVTFQISIDATNYYGENQIRKYYVIDKLQTGFKFEGIDSVTVDGETLDEDENIGYSLTESDPDKPVVEDGKKYNQFVVGLKWAKKNSEDVWENIYPANAQIVIRYRATLNTDAVIADDGNENKAKFTYVYTDKPEDPTEDPEDPGNQSSGYETTTTYTYALAIKKVDETGKPLAGAKFEIKPDGTNTTAIKLTKLAPSAGEESSVYIYDEDSSNTEVETPSTGIVIIKGVKGEKTGLNYIVTETQAPAGYNKLQTSQTITAVTSTKYTTSIWTYKDGDGNVISKEDWLKLPGNTEENAEKQSNTVEETTVNANVIPLVVKNNKGVLLPSTGGMGTTIFYIIGGILVIGAGVLLITKKRMSTK